MSIHEEQLHTLQDGYDENEKQLFLSGVIQRFYNNKIKIEVDRPEKKDLLIYIFKECGLKHIENKYSFEKGRFFWVENGLFGKSKNLHNSMNLLFRNRRKETIKLSELNVV